MSIFIRRDGHEGPVELPAIRTAADQARADIEVMSSDLREAGAYDITADDEQTARFDAIRDAHRAAREVRDELGQETYFSEFVPAFRNLVQAGWPRTAATVRHCFDVVTGNVEATDQELLDRLRSAVRNKDSAKGRAVVGEMSPWLTAAAAEAVFSRFVDGSTQEQAQAIREVNETPELAIDDEELGHQEGIEMITRARQRQEEQQHEE